MQVRERRIAHAEVVDREPHAEGLQLAEAIEIDVRVLHDRAFRQLDHQAAGLQARHLERVAHVGDQVAVLQVASRHVHRDAQAAAVGHGRAPLAHLGAGLDQHLLPEFDDPARLFRDLDERARHDDAALRVTPADQGLDAEQLAARQVDDRLVLDEEFVPGQGVGDVPLEPQAVVQLLLHLRLEQHEARLAGGLGVVHRDVGVAQQLLGVVVRP